MNSVGVVYIQIILKCLKKCSLIEKKNGITDSIDHMASAIAFLNVNQDDKIDSLTDIIDIDTNETIDELPEYASDDNSVVEI